MPAQKSEPWTSRDVINLLVIIMVAGVIGFVLWQILCVLVKVAAVAACIGLICMFGASAGRGSKKAEGSK